MILDFVKCNDTQRSNHHTYLWYGRPAIPTSMNGEVFTELREVTLWQHG